MDILTTVSTRQTPQSRAADSRQIKNAAGGYTFAVGEWARVHRFLTLGTDGGTYYTNARELTAESGAVILCAAATDPIELVRRIVDVCVKGRAPKQNPALFALAVAAAAEQAEGRRAALAALPQVARTGTQLFLFARYVEQFRGWGPALCKAVARWYTEKPVDKLAYQVLKYRQRQGWTHRDLLRLSHPMADSLTRAAVFDYVCGRRDDTADLPELIGAFEAAQAADRVADWTALIGQYPALSWEMLPDAALGHADVWEALIAQGIPQTALMRQLPRLTRLGVTKGRLGAQIADQLADGEQLKRGRVHPINVLVAQRTYSAGRSARGESTWAPTGRISDALDAAFYHAYGAVEPTGKRTLLALDVSGSMGSAVSGLPLTCREASSALAMVTAATEPDHRIVGFTSAGDGPHGWQQGSAIAELDISPRRRLDDICRYTAQIPFGRTDCALPMVWALRNRVEVDTFQVYTDNETWHGNIHPHQALREYREKMGIPARLVVVAMTATGSTIADPADPGQLDVSGFDSAVPQLLADFSRGSC